MVSRKITLPLIDVYVIYDTTPREERFIKRKNPGGNGIPHHQFNVGSIGRNKLLS
jgi:hypothetical protein